MPKEDCKYWDKCYQKNSAHLEKYNHPKQEEKEATLSKRRSTEPVPCGDATSSTNKKESNKPKYETDKLKAEALANISGKDWMAVLQKRIKLSEQQEYDNLLKTTEFLRHKFLVEMPPDFYSFWKFVEQLKPDIKGENLLAYIEKQFQLMLVGPFEFLAGKFDGAKLCEPGDYLRHWRFYYDPPEFQTVFVRKGSGIHYGYWRDTPDEKEALLIARNDASKNYEFEMISGNVFDAFLYFLEKDFQATPFTAAAVVNAKKSVQNYIKTNALQLESLEKLRRVRSTKVVCKTFHRAGIVVPFDSKTKLGYRPLIESDAEIKDILKLLDKAGSSKDDKDDPVTAAVIEKLQPIATAATIAVDECDFGTALELGMDLFCSGYPQLHALVQTLLIPSYSLLKRPQFIAIMKAHLDRRIKSLKLSMFDYGE